MVGSILLPTYWLTGLIFTQEEEFYQIGVKAAHLALEMSASTDGIITVAGRDSTSPTSGKKLRAGYSGRLVLELRVPKS